MPKKSVWEMNAAERLHYSLSARTFHAVLILSIIISLAAVVLGFTFYTDALNRDFRTRTWQVAKTAATILDNEELEKEAEAVLSVYNSIPESERQRDDDAYLTNFSFLLDENFENLRQHIHQIQTESDCIAGYAAALDIENNRMIFINDGDPNDTFCAPGYWDAMKPEWINAYLNGTEGSFFDRFYNAPKIPSIITKMDQYGYRCTAGVPVTEVNGYPVMIFYDTDMNQTAQAARSFLWMYVALLAVVTVITAYFMVRHLKKTVVAPINELAETANEFIADKRSGNSTQKSYFDKLNIRTGDEIENLSLTMQTMEKGIVEYEQSLTRVVADRERIQTELSLASRIQEGMLPHIFPPFPSRREFSLYASMDPAKEVGGDFYDFFFLDDNHLALVIADVSGKGVPAALFMMISKSLIKSTVQNGNSPGAALTSVNAQLAENNDAEMFVSVWLAVIDVRTGKGLAANAGHEHPALRRAGGAFELQVYRHSPVLGLIEGLKIKEHEFELNPGDSIFVYTDGVPEATNGQNELFGTDRMLQALNQDPDADSGIILENIARAVDEFVDGAEQFDDLTMLCFKYRGPAAN